jgi:hypothetical protein
MANPCFFEYPFRKVGIPTWDAHHHSTVGSHQMRRSHFVKLCHRYLPAGKFVHGNNQSHPDQWPLCSHPQEEHQHILQCIHATRQKWRDNLATKLSAKCVALKTNPVLKSILLNGVKCWLHQLPFDKGGIPAAYDQLLTDQRDIGWWYHLCVAQFSKNGQFYSPTISPYTIKL